MVPVYRAGRQMIKVRAVMMVSLAGLLLCSLWAVELAQTHGLNPGDGGKLAPLPERLAWGALVGALGVAFAAGMWLYGRHYAGRIEFDADTKQVHLYTVGFFGDKHHAIDVADLGSVRAHHDTNWGLAAAALAVGHPIPVVDAPWRSVRIKGWRWALIVDRQGVVQHPKLMRMLFGD